MDTRLVTSFAALAEHPATEWQALSSHSQAATVFQTWEWTAAWWEHFGRGKQLRTLLFHEGKTLVGVAPLFVPLGPLRPLRPLSTGSADYLDLLAAPGYESAVAAGLADWLDSHRRQWDWLDLPQLRPGAIAEGVPGSTLWDGETCPFRPLEPTGEAFLKSLGKKLRQNIGYYERTMAKQHALEIRLASAATLDADLDAFFALHQQRWRSRWMPGAFASEQNRAFHRSAARALFAAGKLRLHTLLLDQEPVASLYCFHKDKTTYYYLGGFAPALAKLSPGTVLTAKAILHAIEYDGATEFDFLRGDEPYKYRWGAQDRFNRRLSRTRPGLRPVVLATAGKLALQTELRLKHWMHTQHGGGKQK